MFFFPLWIPLEVNKMMRFFNILIWRPCGIKRVLFALTFGLLPPMAPGLMEPVSWYLHRILDTQPWDTRSWREMTHGRMPWWAISTILCRMWLGRGLPLMKTPPSWLTRPCPNGVDTGQQGHLRIFFKAIKELQKLANLLWAEYKIQQSCSNCLHFQF